MSSIACSVERICPAKINVSLSILGRREDGFHDLHSVVAQTRFGDRLRLEWDPKGERQASRLSISGATGLVESLSTSENTVLQAIELFREATGIRTGSIQVELEKRIPAGAGLGGGSSDAVGTFRALQEVFPEASAKINWKALAARIGSDCPLFLNDGPVIMENRGELITGLGDRLAERLRNRPVILFKPGFSINTPEAYKRLAKRQLYTSRGAVNSGMREWESGRQILPPMGNDFERLCSSWLPSLSVVLGQLRSIHGLDVRLSGSGSACFLLTEDAEAAGAILRKVLEDAWGDNRWMESSILK